MIIYLAGYESHCPKSLLEHAERLNALILDIRLSPYSRHPRWRWKQMSQVFGERYDWVNDWGNRRYRQGPPIEIANWEEGLRLFKKLTQERGFENTILLCACRAETECHRAIIGKRLRDEGYTVKSLVWLKPTKTKPAKETPNRTLSLLEMGSE